MSKYIEASGMPEGERIRMIGRTVMKLPVGRTVAFCVDHENGTKADRYIGKLLELFPALEIKDRFVGPMDGVESVVVHKKPQ